MTAEDRKQRPVFEGVLMYKETNNTTQRSLYIGINQSPQMRRMPVFVI
jgi:hypothetical protein